MKFKKKKKLTQGYEEKERSVPRATNEHPRMEKKIKGVTSGTPIFSVGIQWIRKILGIYFWD